ncbi:hypothetical protein KUTeg_014197 [Tegillarca granosa]|uniref:Cation efflux protein transmembrane domain-containing protein n=1 Tax=Tegillarca granosa TaxID=220873 RepID=A0ABQ9EVY4_TEGGR|nr:hypothetical protein KUTeg_014197 [Tegillarca granosa]
MYCIVYTALQQNVRREEDQTGTQYYTSGTIYPFAPQKSLMKTIFQEVSSVIRRSEAKKILLFLKLNIIALTAYTYLTIFDIFRYERFEVLAVFASTMLAQLGSFFVIKESIEKIILQSDIHTGRLLVGTIFAFCLHMVVIYSINNRAMNHVVDASSSSWLQEHMTDMSESICHVIPGLSKLLLPRINPFALIGFAGGFALCITYVLIDTKAYYSADPWAAIAIAIMTCGTMFPMSVYTGKILLQTAPSHILGQLDKILREASTLDGVLEFRNEHFWTVSFGILAGSLQVRVRRDADEQMVLAHVYNRLSNLVSLLTIQIFKDDWTRTSSAYSLRGNPAFSSNFMSTSPSPPLGMPRGPSPILGTNTGGGFQNVPLGPASPTEMTFSHDFKTSTPLRGTTFSAARPISGNIMGHGHSHGSGGSHGHSHQGHGHSH